METRSTTSTTRASGRCGSHGNFTERVSKLAEIDASLAEEREVGGPGAVGMRVGSKPKGEPGATARLARCGDFLGTCGRRGDFRPCRCGLRERTGFAKRAGGDSCGRACKALWREAVRVRLRERVQDALAARGASKARRCSTYAAGAGAACTSSAPGRR